MKNDKKMVQVTVRSWVKSIKIDKICDVISWTFSVKQYLDILFLRKYFFKSFETLVVETFAYKRSLKKMNGFHEMKHNSAIICQSQLEFLEVEGKRRFLIAA